MEIKHFIFAKDVITQDLGKGVSRKILAYHQNIMMVEAIFDEGSIGSAHTHPHEQATYVLEGEFEFTIGDERHIVKQGDTVYMEPDILHGAVCLKKGRLLDVFTPMREDFI